MDGAPLAKPTWLSHLRAVWAIAAKDCISFARYPLNAAFRVVEPAVWLTPVFFLGKTFGSSGQSGFAAVSGTSDYMAFIVLGAVLSNFVSAVFWGMGFGMKNEMNSGTLENNWMAPIPRWLYLVGQTLSSLIITTFTSASMLVLARLLFGVRITGDVLAAITDIVPMLVALYGFGFAFGAVILLMRDANTMVDVTTFVVMLFSGSLFPVQVLPRFFIPFALALPLTYGYDAVRGHLLKTRTLLPLPYETLILAIFMVVMVPLGYSIFCRIDRKCRIEGTLWMH